MTILSNKNLKELLENTMEKTDNPHVDFLIHKGKVVALAFFDMHALEDEDQSKMELSGDLEQKLSYKMAYTTIAFMSAFIFQNTHHDSHQEIREQLIKALKWGKISGDLTNGLKPKNIEITVKTTKEAKELLETLQKMTDVLEKIEALEKND